MDAARPWGVKDEKSGKAEPSKVEKAKQSDEALEEESEGEAKEENEGEDEGKGSKAKRQAQDTDKQSKTQRKGRGRVAAKKQTSGKQKSGGRTSKAQPSDADSTPMAQRTAVSSLKKAMYIGAHVSAAGGVDKAVRNALDIGANAFALFLKSQRKWSSSPLAADVRARFVAACQTHGLDAGAHLLPHGSYLVNLAQRNPAKAEQAYKCFVDDLQRCEQLGIRLYNFHPGSTLGHSRDAAVASIAAHLNRAHAETHKVVTVLENMAGGGNALGAPWEDLRDIIALVNNKDRVGVCIDTCHAFAAGHDLRTPEALKDMLQQFDSIVGLSYLKALHLNDSKAPLGSRRDLHANIGTGFLGLRAFHAIVNTDAFAGLPMVLETPIERPAPEGDKLIEDRRVWAQEIKLLESLVGMDADSDEFAALEWRLHSEGAAERVRIQNQVERKAANNNRAAGRKKRRRETDEEDSE